MAVTLEVTLSTDELLSQRAKTHGDYAVHALFTQGIKSVMCEDIGNWHKLSDIQRESLDMIAHKIGRILAGDPDVADHWDDIAGYARLVAQRLTEKQASRAALDEIVADAQAMGFYDTPHVSLKDFFARPYND